MEVRGTRWMEETDDEFDKVGRVDQPIDDAIGSLFRLNDAHEDVDDWGGVEVGE